MTEKKKFFILGKVFHRDDTSPIELLSERDDEAAVSKEVGRLMNENFPPKNIFIIEGVRRDIYIKDISVNYRPLLSALADCWLTEGGGLQPGSIERID